MSSVSGSDFIGYETSVTIDRICMPSSAVLSDAFAAVVDSLSSSMQTGDFASMTSDVENVRTSSNIELAVAAVRDCFCCYCLPRVHVLA